MISILRQPGILRQWLSGISWTVASSGIERIISVGQTILIARFLGIEEYGRYGLIFGTVGFVASLAGLQLGLMSAVYVARFRTTNPRAAAGVIVFSESLSLALALVGLAVMMVAPEQAASWLLKDGSYASVMLPAGLLVLLSVIAGVQEGVLQGFEAFKTLAWIRVVVSVFTLGLVVIAGQMGGLKAILLAVAGGWLLRSLVMLVMQRRLWPRHGIRFSLAAMMSQRRLLFDFSVPSVLATIGNGFGSWYGTYLLSRLPGGFHDVAIATVGSQWRSPVMFLTASLAAVAIPLISRSTELSHRDVGRVHRANLWSNLTVAIGACVVIAIGSSLILKAYGTGFGDRRFAFLLIVISVIPQSHATVFFQYLVGSGQMWRQLIYLSFLTVSLVGGYWIAIPRAGVIGYGSVTLATWSVIALTLHLRVSKQIRGNALTQQPITTSP